MWICSFPGSVRHAVNAVNAVYAVNAWIHSGNLEHYHATLTSQTRFAYQFQHTKQIVMVEDSLNFKRWIDGWIVLLVDA